VNNGFEQIVVLLGLMCSPAASVQLVELQFLETGAYWRLQRPFWEEVLEFWKKVLDFRAVRR